MRRNSLAFRLFATSVAWTLLVLPLAGYLIYSLYRNDVQTSFDMQLKKLLTVLTLDSMNTAGDEPVRPNNQYEPLFEVTHSGWYWQVLAGDRCCASGYDSAGDRRGCIRCADCFVHL